MQNPEEQLVGLERKATLCTHFGKCSYLLKDDDIGLADFPVPGSLQQYSLFGPRLFEAALLRAFAEVASHCPEMQAAAAREHNSVAHALFRLLYCALPESKQQIRELQNQVIRSP